MTCSNVCYRCRKISTKKQPLYKCSYCTLFWHLNCLLQPLTEIPESGWKCPRHLERSVTRRHLKKKNQNGSSVKVIQPEDDMPSLVANDIVKYGGVVYETKASMIESEFIAYARRYRNDMSAKEDMDETCSAEKWLESLQQPFKLFEPKRHSLQLLIDASKMQPTVKEEEIEINDKEYEKLEAIEELIKLKGEQNLLDLLSKN